jgi:hypothetical protein
MKAEELRIGNFVYQTEHKFSSNPFKSIKQFDESNWYRIGECIEFLEDFEPIPLTEEWLLKFGFSKNRHTYNWHNVSEYFGMIEQYGVTFTYVESGNFDTIYGREIRHVHQLQNLYFALTGKELEINQITQQ